MMNSKFLCLAALFVCAAPVINAANIAINVQDFSFNPASQSINVGDTVTWTWTGAAQHSVTQGTSCTTNGFDSGLKTTGTFQQTFNTAGTINYFCSRHCGGGMVATLTVNAPAGNATTTTTPATTASTTATTTAASTSTTTTTAATTTTSTTIASTSTSTSTTQAPVSGGGPIHYVAVNSYAFTPSNLIINPGDTVVFYLVAGFHNVISTTGFGVCTAASGTAALTSPGTSLPASTTANYSVTLNTPGIYPYMCQIHCASHQMYAQISVAHPVSVNNYVFTPSNLNINAGESVVFYLITGFHNVVSTTAAASCTAATGAAAVLASSGASLSAATTANYTVTLTKAGVYPYMCQYHCASPNNMYAQITVLGAGGGNNGAFKTTQMNLAAIIGLAIAMAVGAMRMQRA